MAQEPTEGNTEKRTGLNRIADELHRKFCLKTHVLRWPGACWYHDAGRFEMAYWLERARGINDIVREELVR